MITMDQGEIIRREYFLNRKSMRHLHPALILLAMEDVIQLT